MTGLSAHDFATPVSVDKDGETFAFCLKNPERMAAKLHEMADSIIGENPDKIRYAVQAVTVNTRAAHTEFALTTLTLELYERVKLEPAGRQPPPDHQQSNVDFVAAAQKSYLGDCTDSDERLAAAWWGWRAARGEIPKS
jgi:hypothetical protein